jgi:hypothetical protein
MTASSPPALLRSPSLSRERAALLHPFTAAPLLYKIYQATVVFEFCVFAKLLNLHGSASNTVVVTASVPLSYHYHQSSTILPFYNE